MVKMMLVGKTGCGKTTLTQAILGEELTYKKTQAISYCDSIVDTPGEYIENRRYYNALISSSSKCDLIALVQDATAQNSIFPPKFASLFKKKVIGIITKTDIEGGNLSRAEKFLHWAGANEIVESSSMMNIGIDTLRKYLILEN
ncbi:MAG: EutP/PduV family microcompartment system protein [Desulfobacterales bacterium]|nr:EutP/PduV family microcompartment system protein [Desulfobacterales bacterium]MCP4158932.1 EutP/PduV family microcompartment system protein [Deltaproteobacteria bacterium]